MGIYDRDYYRESPDSWWPTWTGHQAVWLIIVVTSVIFVLQLIGLSTNGRNPDDIFPEQIGKWGSFNYPEVANGQVWRLLTAHFVHSPYSLISVALGMLALYFIGQAVEGIYGPAEFLAFYLLVGVIITGTLTVLGLLNVPIRPIYFGCQGILTAVLVLFACHFPQERIYVLIIPVPAWLLATLWVGFSILGFFGGASGTVPHLIAALTAYTYQRINFRILGFWPGWSWRPATRRPQLKVHNPTPVSATEYDLNEPTTPHLEDRPRVAVEARPLANPVDEQLEAKLDQLLEKVSKSGRASLTEEEQAILQKASAEYKRRRNQQA